MPDNIVIPTDLLSEKEIAFATIEGLLYQIIKLPTGKQSQKLVNEASDLSLKHDLSTKMILLWKGLDKQKSKQSSHAKKQND